MDHDETWCDRIDWIQPAQWSALMSTDMNLGVA
jgi:hypothetical protein